MPCQPIPHPYGPPKFPPPSKPLPSLPGQSTPGIPAAEPRRPPPAPPLMLPPPAMNAPSTSQRRRPSQPRANEPPRPFVNPNPRPPGVPVGGIYYGKNGPPARADGHPPRTSSLQKPVMVQAKRPQKANVVQPATRIKSSQAYVYRSSQPAPSHPRFSFEPKKPKKLTAKEAAAKNREFDMYRPGKRRTPNKDFKTGLPAKIARDQTRYNGKIEVPIRREMPKKKGSGCIVM